MKIIDLLNLETCTRLCNEIISHLILEIAISQKFNRHESVVFLVRDHRVLFTMSIHNSTTLTRAEVLFVTLTLANYLIAHKLYTSLVSPSIADILLILTALSQCYDNLILTLGRHLPLQLLLVLSYPRFLSHTLLLPLCPLISYELLHPKASTQSKYLLSVIPVFLTSLSRVTSWRLIHINEPLLGGFARFTQTNTSKLDILPPIIWLLCTLHIAISLSDWQLTTAAALVFAAAAIKKPTGLVIMNIAEVILLVAYASTRLDQRS